MTNRPRPKAPTTNAPRPPTTGSATGGPRQKLQAPDMNAPRPPTERSSPEVMKRLTSAQTSTLASQIGQGPGAMHRNSENRMHEERAYVYDRMSKGALMTKVLNAKTAINPLSSLNGGDRDRLTEEAMSLKPFKKEMKEMNPEASRHEKVAKTAKYTKTGASVVSAVGTGVALVNPIAGVATKATAQAVGIGAGLVAADQHNRAAKAYGSKIDEGASGDAMFQNNIRKAKVDLNVTKRNHELVSTGVSALTSGLGHGTDALTQGTTEVAKQVIGGLHKANKAVGGVAIKETMETREAKHKSEIVNNMMHLRSRQVRKK